jgi:hypothetical protein
VDIAVISDLHLGSDDPSDSFGHDAAEFLRFLTYLESNFEQVVLLATRNTPGSARLDGSFNANKTKTFKANRDELYRLLRDKRQRARWWDGPEVTVLSATPGQSLRWKLADGCG